MALLNPPRCMISAPAVVTALGLPFAMTTALAQSGPRPPGQVPYLNQPQAVPSTRAPAADPADKITTQAPAGDGLKQREQELEAVRAEQKRAIENEAKLKREVEAIGDDRRLLNQQLVDTATRIRDLEESVGKIEERLQPLDERQQTLRKSLEERRHLVTEVLAALQRIGRRPPPAILVRPEDALESVRSAMMLDAVLPEMRQQTEVLVTDLTELVRLRSGIAQERSSLARDLFKLADDRQRVTLLIEQRQKQQTDMETALAAERQRAGQLGRQAEDVKELIGKLEQGLDSATRAARGPGTRSGDEKKSLDGRPALAALTDPGRLAPAIAFASAKKQLPMPVNGVRIREFNASDGLGGTEKGLSIASRPGAQVTAPCDGWVVYAGAFRNYGQLLILNAGDGYHVLLAGMERISVDLGQFVVTGEPVAVMGGRLHSAVALASGSGQPVLYVEFRKDGTPVDPSPWWATSGGEKVRG
jgi:murein hydrolase activator